MIFHNCLHAILRQGVLFGGCVEVLYSFFSREEFPELYWDHQDYILFLETSEEMANSSMVYNCLRTLFCKGAFKRLVGIVVALPKIQFLGRTPSGGIDLYRKEQQDAIGK